MSKAILILERIKECDVEDYTRNIASSYNYIYEKLLEHLDEKSISRINNIANGK